MTIRALYRCAGSWAMPPLVSATGARELAGALGNQVTSVTHDVMET